MANFISMVFAFLKDEGVDTTDMTPKEAIDKFNELGLGDKDKLKKDEINNHTFTKKQLGTISKSSIVRDVLKDRLKNDSFVISSNYERHIEKGHGTVFNDYKQYIPEIINKPQYIFDGNSENRVVFIRRIDRQVELILELGLTKEKPNQIISMWTTTNKDIKRLEKKHKLLYKSK